MLFKNFEIVEKYHFLTRKQQFEDCVTNGRLNNELLDSVERIKAVTQKHISELLKNEYVSQFPEFSKEVIEEATNSVYDNAVEQIIGCTEGHLLHRRLLSNLSEALHDYRSYSFIDAPKDLYTYYLALGYEEFMTSDDKKERKCTLAQMYERIIKNNITQVVACDLVINFASLDLEKIEVDSKKEYFKVYMRNLVDSWAWPSVASLTFNESEETGLSVNPRSGSETLRFNINFPSFKRLSASNIEIDSRALNFRGKKVALLDVEKVSYATISSAARKMKFIGDLKHIEVYKILKGYQIKSSRNFTNTWSLRGLDEERLLQLFEDISEHYVIISKSPTRSFQAITTSIGRGLSSTNRKVTGAVMDSFNLSF